jgi:glycine oxidase
LTPDFLIIGAGATGLATALELADAGADVAVIERGQAGQESTWAGGGILSPLPPWAYGDAVNALSDYSRALFPDWCADLRARSGVDVELRHTGMLILPPHDTATATTWCEAHGWRWTTRDSGDFLPGAGREALWLPDVDQARNPRLVRALRGAALARGIRLLESTEARALRVDGDRVTGVDTDGGPLAAAACIVAAGAWSGILPGLDGFGRRIWPVRGQMLLFQCAPDTLATVILENGRYLIPRADGHILAGSTLEDVGFDKSVTTEARASLLDFAHRLLPALGPDNLTGQWSGLRPGSPDNIPAIGRHPRLANLYLNSGHFRYGVTMAPGSARLLRALIENAPPPIAPEPYRPE